MSAMTHSVTAAEFQLPVRLRVPNAIKNQLMDVIFDDMHISCLPIASATSTMMKKSFIQNPEDPVVPEVPAKSLIFCAGEDG